MIHNDVNELTGIDLTANGTPDLDLTYDGAGNLREEDGNANTTYRYTHDLWNRLVKIEIDKASNRTKMLDGRHGPHLNSHLAHFLHDPLVNPDGIRSADGRDGS